MDKGCGIAAEDIPYVASHFFKKKSKHIGMGLTFAQRIVEELDGELTIDSSEGREHRLPFSSRKREEGRLR